MLPAGNIVGELYHKL